LGAKPINLSVFMLFLISGFFNTFSQTYRIAYKQTYTDSIVGYDQKSQKQIKIPFTKSAELNLVRAGDYGISFWSNGQSSLGRLNGLNDLLSRNPYTLYDYYTHTLWYSYDSSFSVIEYKVVGSGESISSKEIRYDLEPGIYVIVNKDIPPQICPNIFLFGLKYGVSKFVSHNTVVELESYQTIQSLPPALNLVADIFKQISPSMIRRVCPPYFNYQRSNNQKQDIK
jgi:hypothetical protein